jgi:hypothetical protein
LEIYNYKVPSESIQVRRKKEEKKNILKSNYNKNPLTTKYQKGVYLNLKQIKRIIYTNTTKKYFL